MTNLALLMSNYIWTCSVLKKRYFQMTEIVQLICMIFDPNRYSWFSVFKMGSTDLRQTRLTMIDFFYYEQLLIELNAIVWIAFHTNESFWNKLIRTTETLSPFISTNMNILTGSWNQYLLFRHRLRTSLKKIACKRTQKAPSIPLNILKENKCLCVF